jgi:hypothetical protein
VTLPGGIADTVSMVGVLIGQPPYQPPHRRRSGLNRRRDLSTSWTAPSRLST